MAIEHYLEEYDGIMRGVRKETYKKYPTETEMLFEFIDNWIDLIPRDKEKFFRATNSISGIILLNSWKLTNWISCEILNGKYFEAIRNLRFVFEGSVYAVIIEDAIESKVFEKWRDLSTLSLKAEVFELWEECRKKKVYRDGKMNLGQIKNIVVDFVHRNLDPSRSKKAKEYIEVYMKILSNEKLYLSTGEMIEECSHFLKIDKENARKLRNLWHELSRYLHFSYPYLKAIIENPEFCFSEVLDDELFKCSLTFYFQTLDFFYAVLVWRFADLREEIEKICEWWKNNFNKTFSLTEKVLRSVDK